MKEFLSPKASPVEHVRESLNYMEEDPANAGPFITMPRQFGRHDFSRGLIPTRPCTADSALLHPRNFLLDIQAGQNNISSLR